MAVSFFLFQILHSWWWFFFPILTFFLWKIFYFWWINWEVYYPRAFRWILLEIKPPKEVLKPFSAMEDVFTKLFGIIDVPCWRERWCGGLPFICGGGYFTFEICSFGGEIHFYMRIPDFFKNTAMATIFSNYPDAEIFEVEDYTKKVPKDIPNEKWDLYSEDQVVAQKDYYPIKTYSMFFERETEEKRAIEEKRLDPMNQLLEALSRFSSGEQAWIQIGCNPIVEVTYPLVKEAKKEIDRLARRASPPAPKSMPQEVFQTLVVGPTGKAEKPLELIAPELRLTPLEREILTAVENKIKKPLYETWIRILYLCKKDEPHFYGNYKLIRGYFEGQFMTAHLNRFAHFGGTRTRIHYWFKRRRLYLRKRQRFREYLERLPAYFPWNFKGDPPPFIKMIFYRVGPGRRSVSLLSTEELATIFHFPIKPVVPTLPTVEVKKVGPPPTLPTE